MTVKVNYEKSNENKNFNEIFEEFLKYYNVKNIKA